MTTPDIFHGNWRECWHQWNFVHTRPDGFNRYKCGQCQIFYFVASPDDLPKRHTTPEGMWHA